MDLNGDRLPCRTCRTRKVRCTKTTPCSNCQRTGIECIYDRRMRVTAPRSRTPAAQADRIKELELVVANLESQLTDATRSSGSPSGNRVNSVPGEYGHSVFQVELIAEAALREARIAPVDFTASRTGRVITNGGLSRHVHNAFWASMYDEVESLNFILREEQPDTPSKTWITGADVDPAFPCDNVLDYNQCDFLLQTFLANIDVAVRILHKPTFLRQCNQFRRGVLQDFPGFEYLLAAVYNLAFLALSEQDCQTHFARSRSALASRFRHQVERGLGALNITTTNRLSSLQILVLHITYLAQAGEILHASSLLGLALHISQRMGLNRDGSQYRMSHWNMELRRRLWHHMLLLDTICMENYGLDSVISGVLTDTVHPQNVDDSAWDTSDSSTLQPNSQTGFTDMTFFIVHLELAALMRFVLRNSVPVLGNEKSFLDFHSQVRERCWSYIQQSYLDHLDGNIVEHKLVIDSAKLTYERIRLTQLQPLMRAGNPSRPAMVDLETRLFQDAVSYCQHVQAVRISYVDRRLDWIVIRSFCWHALSIMLSTVLRNHALGATAEAKWARERIAQLFIDRPSIDFMRGNETLWQPLERLRTELEYRHFADVQTDELHGLNTGMFDWDPAWNDAAWNPF